MTDEKHDEALDLIHDIAVAALGKCDEPIPEILREALDEIVALSRYKGAHGNVISDKRRGLFDLK